MYIQSVLVPFNCYILFCLTVSLIEDQPEWKDMLRYAFEKNKIFIELKYLGTYITLKTVKENRNLGMNKLFFLEARFCHLTVTC